jgi:NifB/MoaA-like Fe-S oxidoreductase
VRLVPIANRFFGGNIGVTGLLAGADVAAALAGEPAGHRYLLPDVMLSRGMFLDGETVAALPRPVDIVATDGAALVRALAPTS